MGIAQLRKVVRQRDKAAADILAGMTEFENDLARALASGGRLTAILPMARLEAEVSAVVGQDAISHIVGSVGLLAQAMDRTVDGHNRLAELARRFHVPITSVGDKGSIPVVQVADDAPVLAIVRSN